MTAPPTTRETTSRDFNNLKRGGTYAATTIDGTTVGEYLGIEVPHGHWAILLKHSAGIESIPMSCVTSIQRTAA